LLAIFLHVWEYGIHSMKYPASQVILRQFRGDVSAVSAGLT
jgi:hypothetical protein